ncbi:nuclear protein [pteropodid alphaherpesvirus 2]|uniref:Nuclear protein n=1 Tax=pteropodid alphaherpesvirus 2 TaxID=3118716 RepID=A0A510J6W1_9ALPH|nr:nuclear protein [pteropodid alphaherpesvirus 2]BBM13176.1 nuclear protein [pteropodid alphaherpesvirus 2]
MLASPTTIAYSFYGVQTSPAQTLPDTEQFVARFGSGTRTIISGSRERRDSLAGGAIVLQHTPIGFVAIIDCRTDFCTYRFIGPINQPQLNFWEKAQLCAYPFRAWVSSTRGESALSSTAGLVTVVWGTNTIFLTATIYTPTLPAPHPSSLGPASSSPSRQQSFEESGPAADLLVEVMKEIQLSPTLGCADFSFMAPLTPLTPLSPISLPE